MTVSADRSIQIYWYRVSTSVRSHTHGRHVCNRRHRSAYVLGAASLLLDDTCVDQVGHLLLLTLVSVVTLRIKLLLRVGIVAGVLLIDLLGGILVA